MYHFNFVEFCESFFCLNFLLLWHMVLCYNNWRLVNCIVRWQLSQWKMRQKYSHKLKVYCLNFVSLLALVYCDVLQTHSSRGGNPSLALLAFIFAISSSSRTFLTSLAFVRTLRKAIAAVHETTYAVCSIFSKPLKVGLVLRCHIRDVWRNAKIPRYATSMMMSHIQTSTVITWWNLVYESNMV